MDVRFKLDLYSVRSKKFLLSVSLLFIIVLVFSCLFFVFNNVTPDYVVSNKTELENAVNNAVGHVIIALDRDIQLTESLTIPANKNITLTSSNSRNGFYRLIGANGVSALVVENGGVLRIEGIIVTHETGVYGNGIFVNSSGTLILYSGVICNNIVPDDYYNLESVGGGVRNWGSFSMSGGKIVNNTAGGGGGVLNWGSFSMSGGEIYGNTALGGGGVNTHGKDFCMSGGKIYGNTAYDTGGGVNLSNGKFSLSGNGVICDNTADVGGGVYNRWGTFVMSGGVISGNAAWDKGGGVYNYYMWSSFSLSGGVISNNTANLGGGVCSDDEFNMSGGEISNNTANTGGGVYVGNGSFNQFGGKIYGNIASQVGDDIFHQKLTHYLTASLECLVAFLFF